MGTMGKDGGWGTCVCYMIEINVIMLCKIIPQKTSILYNDD